MNSSWLLRSLTAEPDASISLISGDLVIEEEIIILIRDILWAFIGQSSQMA
jgi:hypothetical protein